MSFVKKRWRASTSLSPSHPSKHRVKAWNTTASSAECPGPFLVTRPALERPNCEVHGDGIGDDQVLQVQLKLTLVYSNNALLKDSCHQSWVYAAHFLTDEAINELAGAVCQLEIEMLVASVELDRDCLAPPGCVFLSGFVPACRCAPGIRSVHSGASPFPPR